jgi:3-dehydrosphinganine reductase
MPIPPRVSVITGGSSGLGLALGHALAAGGDRVILVARDAAKLEAAVRSITQECVTNTVFCKMGDVAIGADMQMVADQVAAENGGIDLWINSAGIMREGYFEKLTDNDFREVFDINLFGTINCVRAALPYLRESKGQIVNIASMAAHTGVFGYSAYCASKHALKGLTESLYHELRAQGITVQLICPPEFESPMATSLEDSRSPENAAHTLMIPREPVDVIVRDTLKAIATGRYHTITGFRARVMGLVIQHFPGFARSIAQLTIRRVQKARNT